MDISIKEESPEPLTSFQPRTQEKKRRQSLFVSESDSEDAVTDQRTVARRQPGNDASETRPVGRDSDPPRRGSSTTKARKRIQAHARSELLDDSEGDENDTSPVARSTPSNTTTTAQSQSGPSKSIAVDLKKGVSRRKSRAAEASLSDRIAKEARDIQRGRTREVPKADAPPDVRYAWPASMPPPKMFVAPSVLRERGEAGLAALQKDRYDKNFDPSVTRWIDRHDERIINSTRGWVDAPPPERTLRERLVEPDEHLGVRGPSRSLGSEVAMPTNSSVKLESDIGGIEIRLQSEAPSQTSWREEHLPDYLRKAEEDPFAHLQ